MKEDDQVPAGKGMPRGFMIFRPEEEAFQRLYLCNYLNELPEIAENEAEDSGVAKQEAKI